MNWAVLVVWNDGEEEYLMQGLGQTPARLTKARAKEQVEFMKIGMEDYQSINVVRYPKESKCRSKNTVNSKGARRT